MRQSTFIIPKDRQQAVNPLKVVAGNGKFRLPPVPVTPPGAKEGGNGKDTDGANGSGGGEAKRGVALKRVPFHFYSKRYLLRRQITGGQAMVYLAWDRELEMHVALKFLPEHLLRSKMSVADLKREASVAMRLTHENIVRLHNVDLENAKPFIVMEYVDGETLSAILRRVKAVSMRSLLGVGQSAVAALAYAHARRVLHRDVKPGNIMIDGDGVLKILDLGSAVGMMESKSGQYIEGTPGYMAPEQVEGVKVDGRADIFGLGAVLWELATGRPAFPDRRDYNHMYDRVPESGGAIPPGVEAVLLKAMARDPAGRWSTMEEFGAALTAAVENVL